MNSEQEKLALHFKYCAFIAILIIVAIATERWSESKDFTTYLSNAATMTSLILGIVAIFYSFISNDSMSRSLGSITTVNDEVRKTREEIGEFSILTEQAVEVGKESSIAVTKASSGISTSMAALTDTLTELASQNEKLQVLITALPTRMDQLEVIVGDVAKSLGEKAPANTSAAVTQEIPDSAIESLLSRSTVTQNLLLHAIVLSCQKKKFFSIAEFCKETELNFENNLFGYFGAISALKICTRAVNSQRKYKITGVHPALEAKARSYIVNYLENEVPHSEEGREKWLTAIKKIDAMFM